MRAPDALLHGLSLSACVVLGAGFWQLHRMSPVQVPAPPALTPSPEPASGQAEALQALARDVEGLRLRLADLEKPRPVPVQGQAVAATPSPPPSSLPAEGIMAALDDPKVQEKLRKMREDQDRKARQRSIYFEGMNLDDAKRADLEKLVTQSQSQIGGYIQKFHIGEWTRGQVRGQIEMARSELDAKVRPFLTAEQYKIYLDRIAGSRSQIDQWLSSPQTQPMGSRGPQMR